LGAGYEGRCSKIHGHSYTVRIELTSNDPDELGMVVDFNELEPLEAWLDIMFDHCLLLNGNDPKHQQAAAFLEELGLASVWLFNGNPTVELIAEAILDEVLLLEELRGLVSAVTVWETAKCSARVEWKAQTSGGQKAQAVEGWRRNALLD
jgi:6-pyruvoyltetrahydropterin/6-carboxytetrahydropterin synthase